ncbi:MAG TPA: hypothetical protein PKE45_08390 [Caldilineaceae bacterium]|nr:hypothetical protein [Caldilineaceae bacterium]
MSKQSGTGHRWASAGTFVLLLMGLVIGPSAPAYGEASTERHWGAPLQPAVVIYLPYIAASFAPELVASLQPVDGIAPNQVDALLGLAGSPHTLIVTTENKGAQCGGGTPASVWKITLDPLTKRALGVVHKQLLDGTQTTRQSLFESTDGTLFTGGGWCGFTPPYYSTDQGESWHAADAGAVYPPNSTFSFAELNGAVYAGTGYDPYPAEVYRWLGAGQWEKVFTSPFPLRNLMATMITFHGRMFVAPQIYGSGFCEGTTAVYVTSDGTTFLPTTGIPPCENTWKFMLVGNNLVAYVFNRDPYKNTSLYRWDERTETWVKLADYQGIMQWGNAGKPMAAYAETIYGYGRALPDGAWGLYRSTDLGLTWELIVPFASPPITAIAGYEGDLYFATGSDALGAVSLYRLWMSPPYPNMISKTGAESASGGGQVDVIDQDLFAISSSTTGNAEATSATLYLPIVHR